MHVLKRHVKSQVQNWDLIPGNGSENTTFEDKFKRILQNKIVLNQNEIELFKKIVDGKKEGVWMQDLLKLYNDVNYMDMFPQLVKYGISGANIPELVESLSPLVFHMFPSSDKSYDCLITASNLEQPLWIYKCNSLREHVLFHHCKSLMDRLQSLSHVYCNKWITIDKIGDFKTDEFEFSAEFILALLYHYDLVHVEMVFDTHCFVFKSVVDSWSPIFEIANEKNIVDSLYKFGLLKNESRIELRRMYECNRSDLTKYMPLRGQKSHPIVITEARSAQILSAFSGDQGDAISTLQHRMKEFYSSDLPISMKEDDILPFTQCVVKRMDRYFRAMVARVSNTDVVLELTDFNWTKTVDKASLMYLHRMFTNLPLQGFSIRLSHITDVMSSKSSTKEWLTQKLIKESPYSIHVIPCKLDGTRRIVFGLVRIWSNKTDWVYLHNLMQDKGEVVVDDEICLFHTKGIC